MWTIITKNNIFDIYLHWLFYFLLDIALYADKRDKPIVIGTTAYPALTVPFNDRTYTAPIIAKVLKMIEHTNKIFFRDPTPLLSLLAFLFFH